MSDMDFYIWYWPQIYSVESCLGSLPRGPSPLHPGDCNESPLDQKEHQLCLLTVDIKKYQKVFIDLFKFMLCTPKSLSSKDPNSKYMDFPVAIVLKIVEKRWLLKVLLKLNKSADQRLTQSFSSDLYLFFFYIEI